MPNLRYSALLFALDFGQGSRGQIVCVCNRSGSVGVEPQPSCIRQVAPEPDCRGTGYLCQSMLGLPQREGCWQRSSRKASRCRNCRHLLASSSWKVTIITLAFVFFGVMC